jgi:hypothetical protein
MPLCGTMTVTSRDKEVARSRSDLPLSDASTAGPSASAPVRTAVTVDKALAMVAPPAPSVPTGPTLINVVGTLVFSVIDFVTKILQGPPAVPAGNTAEVGRSTLQIDCGTGYTAQATWYFPTGPQPPTRLIYFQHGILATDAHQPRHRMRSTPSTSSCGTCC